MPPAPSRLSDFSSGSCRAVVEQAAVEPSHRLEAHSAAGGHHLEQIAGQLGEPLRRRSRMPRHPREHVVRKQADVVGEHADEGVARHGVCASTTSLSCFEMRAFTTCLAGISTLAPVAGLRPMRFSRCCTTSFAIPVSAPQQLLLGHLLQLVEELTGLPRA